MNWKPAALCVIIALSFIISGFFLGIEVFKANARAYIVFDTVYIDSFAGTGMKLIAEETYRPRR